MEYMLSDLILAVMFLRLIKVLDYFESQAKYADPISMKICHFYGFRSDSIFAFKCQLAMDPSRTVAKMFVIIVTVLAYLLRIFEIPYYRANETVNNEMDDYFTSVWLTIITLTTVGYGDISPKTIAGKLIIIVIAIFGTFLISLVVLAVAQIFDLSTEQMKALKHIRMSTQAATLITRFSKFYLSKKRLYELRFEMDKNKKQDLFMKMILKNQERIENASQSLDKKTPSRKPLSIQESKALEHQLESKMAGFERDFMDALEQFKVGRFERNQLDNKELDNSRHQNLIKHEVIEIADMVEDIQKRVKK